MAIFHLHVQHIGKSGNRSAVAASAYRSASKLVEQVIDQETQTSFDITHNFLNKKGVVFSEIFAPEKASLWMRDREALWNLIQNKFDVRKNAVYAQEIDLALPVELGLDENKELLSEFVNEIFVEEGMIADVNIHLDNPDNPHAHIMLSTREIIEDGNGGYTFGKKVRYWDTREFLLYVRQKWAYTTNKYLEIYGLDARISHLSHADRGLGIVPGVKIGAGSKVIGSERVEDNARVNSINNERIKANPELVIDLLRRNKSVFTRDEIERELSKYYGEYEPKEYMHALNGIIGSEKLILSGNRSLDGKRFYVDKERFDLENDFLKLISECKEKDDNKHSLGVEIGDLTLTGIKEKFLKKIGMEKVGIELSKRQKEVVVGVLNDGGLSVIEGLPGAGKTSVMREVVRHYKRYGYKIIATAVSSSAASELGAVIGAEAFNTTKLRYEISKLSGSKWDLNLPINYWNNTEDGKSLLNEKTVLIIDEAAMVDLTEMHYFISEASRVGAKLIFLGDRGQLSAVGIRGGFEKICEKFKPFYLNEVRRQVLDIHKSATRYLAQYKVSDAIEIYRKSNIFIFENTSEIAETKLVRDFIKNYVENKNSIVLSYKNDTILRLNQMIRLKLKELGLIYGKEVAFITEKQGIREERFFAIGDRVVFNRNDRVKGIFNGDVGSIIGVGNHTVRVRIDRNKDIVGLTIPFEIEIDNSYYENLDYGFAVNIYKAQGRSYDFVYGLLDESINYHSFNVMMTRHREDIRIYAGDDILNSELKGRIDQDKWSIKGESEDSIRYAAILSIVSLRDNRSFAQDFNLKPDDVTRTISDYLEAKAEAIQIVTSSAQYNRENLRNTIEIRNKLAKEICTNYAKYSHIIINSNLNYNTIEKHAGLSKYNYSFEEIPRNNLSKMQGFREVIDGCLELQQCMIGGLFDIDNIHINKAREIVIKLHDNTKVIINKFKEIKIDLEEAKIAIDEAVKEKNNAKIYIDEAIEYIDFTIKTYLANIYKEDPKEVLLKWESLVSQPNKLEDVLKAIKKSPQILGKLKGLGLGRLAFNQTRTKARENLHLISEKLEKFEKYKKELPSIKQAFDEAKYDKKIFELSANAKLIDRFLPSLEAEEFIKDIYILSDIYSSQNEIEVIGSMILWSQDKTVRNKTAFYHELFSDQLTHKMQRIKISFDEINRNLSSNKIETIFRDNANILNPDATIEKKGDEISAGSLRMNLKNGLWYRFSTNEGGNIFSFIKLAKNVNILDSLEIIADKAPAPKITNEKNSWVSYQKLPNNAPKFSPQKHMSFMLKENKLEGIYSYKNIHGEIIGYTVRLKNHLTDSKQIIPVSYCHNEILGEDKWRLKGFYDKDGNKPIYGLEKLIDRTSTIIIVEGEKTADVAQKILPEYQVISWLGGSASADKVDWKILKNREVILWPDNDEAGRKSMKVIATILNLENDNIGKVALIDTEKFPPKWDLADSLPDGMDYSDIKEMVENTRFLHKRFDGSLAESHDEIGKRIIWQNRSMGIILRENEIEDQINDYNKISQKLSSNMTNGYIKYALERGVIESCHEFLNLNHELYRETLIATAKSYKNKLDFEKNIPTFIDDVEEKYLEKRKSFTGYKSSEYIHLLPEDKKEIYEILVRDILLLHQLELGNNLSEEHQKIVTKDIYNIVKSNNNPEKIAEGAYYKCSSSNWWRNMAESRLKEKTIENNEYIHSWVEIFKTQRSKAKNIYELYEAMKNEEKFIKDNTYPDLPEDNYIAKIASNYNENPQLRKYLSEDLSIMERFGIKFDGPKFEATKYKNSHIEIENDLRKTCSEAISLNVQNNLSIIEKEGYVKEAEVEYNNLESYAEKYSKDKSLARYLNNDFKRALDHYKQKSVKLSKDIEKDK